jgi:SEC-C motif-containing protein
MMICPCCLDKPYAECCKPYHDGLPAPTALTLMRSRYSAYALGNTAYIIKTTHPKSPYFEKDRKKWEKGIAEFCKTTTFVKLEILDSGENWVHFAAHLKQTEPLVLDERSTFEKVNGKWLYLKGDVQKI